MTPSSSCASSKLPFNRSAKQQSARHGKDGQPQRALYLRRQEYFAYILETIRHEALQGRVYTLTEFHKAFRFHPTIGGSRLKERLQQMVWAGYIKFFRDAYAYGLTPYPSSSYGYLYVPQMLLKDSLRGLKRPVFPTHEVSLCQPLHAVDKRWLEKEYTSQMPF